MQNHLNVKDNNWLIKEKYLDCSYNNGRHTCITSGVQLHLALQKALPIFENKDLKQIISAGVFDVGSNTPRKNLIELGIHSVKCCGHRLNT